ncbi:MAG TPA: 30S ribosomal protein S17 [Smithellaceae bacterium]|jgi:small subunit ribosomal protein S17|nr:30S ribosomal protein S17 [Syntrophaceae bacterium]HOE79590.1 30S ribosomal protein S17 [Smithellaceae bacterium]HPL96096.1 30S ribosomal protein S17 [Smithellaceae bacterium]HPV48823.1 30S ribosomal protein S17 [Smithellaceae bacterium]HQF84072.1 30S ribosomal protein S17 [Smithellaceae bacterium]
MAEKSNKRTLKGVVVSNKMDKTIVVRTQRLVKHPVFHKYVRRHDKYKAHDERNECAVGDTVVIMEARPISRDKRWRMLQILEKAK